MTKLEEQIEHLVEEPIIKLGYKLYDVMYVKEGKDNYLRIFIDNDNGISLNDCESVNNAITDMLDEANYIKEQYFLEISSPGVERLIRREKHLEENIGKEVYVKTFVNIDEINQKEIIGTLKEFNENKIILNNIEDKVEEEDNKNNRNKDKRVDIKDSENKEITIERKNITIIKTVFKW